MRALPLLAFAILVVSGCTSPPPPDPAPDPTPSNNRTTDNTDFETTPPEVLPGGENADIRIRLVDHRVGAESLQVVFDVMNKRSDATYIFGYAFLNTTKGATYIDLPGSIPAGQERRFTAQENDSNDVAHSPWQRLDFYYQVDDETPYGSDEAFAIDLQGRGLPSKVAA
ncbi:MAG: hypothetical protein HY556_11145 [Euryarchaeota archaeon]|nr:hypothetical protein [Euryarchaeota archaeon]